jgi:recombination protein RecA
MRAARRQTPQVGPVRHRADSPVPCVVEPTACTISTMAKKQISAAGEDARSQQFEAFLRDMAKEKPGEVILLGDNTGADVQAVPTGAISLDVALGVGGFPRGRIVELYGPEMSGKTSLALSVAAQCQRSGGTVGFVDAEHALNRQHALDMGVDAQRMVIYQPSSGEDGISMVEKMIESRGFDMVIVDSVAALTPQVEIDGEIGDQQMGLHARLMSKFMRRIAGPCSETNTMLVLINQVRTQLGSYGAPEISTGGKAIKFYASVRIEVRSAMSKKIERNKIVVGQTCVATVKKNKVGPPHRVAEYDLIFGEGIQGESSLMDVAEQVGLITRAGASYTEVATGEKLGMGKEAVKSRLGADGELRDRLVAGVYASLRGVAAVDHAIDHIDDDLGDDIDDDDVA